MKKKISISIIFMIMLFLLSGCGYGVKKGTIVDKKFTPEHTTHGTIVQRVGTVTVATPTTHHYKDEWSIKIQKEENGKIKESWINVTEAKYNQLQIGDYYEESENNER